MNEIKFEFGIETALKNLNNTFRFFGHNGKILTKKEVKELLELSIRKNYKSTSQITEKDFELAKTFAFIERTYRE